MKTFRDYLGKQILFFDGGTGSVLQAQGLKPGELPENWNIEHHYLKIFAITESTISFIPIPSLALASIG